MSFCANSWIFPLFGGGRSISGSSRFGEESNRCKQQLGDDIIVNWDDSGVEIYTSNADRPLLKIDEYKPASVVKLGTKRARVD